jgi:hypothetical protein
MTALTEAHLGTFALDGYAVVSGLLPPSLVDAACALTETERGGGCDLMVWNGRLPHQGGAELSLPMD